MLFLRYLFSIVFSFLIHSLAFSSAPPKSLYLDLNAMQKSSIAIQLVTPVKVKEETPKPIKTQEIATKKAMFPQEKMSKKVIAKPLKNSTKVVQKVYKKPVIKPSKMVSPLKKESNKVKKTVDKKSKSQNETNKVIKKEAPPALKKTNKTPSTASASSSRQSAPKIVDKITFSARPTPIAYPHSAKKRNIEGTVLVEVWLDKQGKQTQQRIINSSGHQILDKAALKGIRQWQFSRQQDDGQAIAYRVQVPINFGLN